MLMTIEDRAAEAAGNWRKFDCFWWHAEPEDGDQWTIVYTSNRDSDLLDQSNAAAIEKIMEPFIADDCRAESHNHWAVGHVDGYAIRVYRDGQVTPAFEAWCEVQDRLNDYPVLDESDYSERETEATYANIVDAAWRLKNQWELPLWWQRDVFGWLWDNDDSAVENRDDRGGYPTEEQLVAAFEGLGYRLGYKRRANDESR